MNVTEWTNGLIDGYETKEAAADAALRDLGRLSQRAQRLLHPILVEHFLMHESARRRAVERQTPIGAIFNGGATTIEARDKRLAESFSLPWSGRIVTWRDATEADHQERIAYLRSHIAGVELTIAEHEKAVAKIQEYGVTCLGEIE